MSLHAQQIVGLQELERVDATTFELRFRTDKACMVTVHAAEDTTYRSAFIFLGRTVGEENRAAIRMDGLRAEADYFYRVFLEQELSPLSGTFSTGKKRPADH